MLSRRVAGRRFGGVVAWGVIVLAVGSAVGFLLTRPSGDAGVAVDPDAELEYVVVVSDFESVVTESGDIESASNAEVRCEVKSISGGAGVTILEIVDEGTFVKKEDLLVRFDDSALQQRLIEHDIQVATDKASVIQAQSDLDKATETLNEYKHGLFLVQKETIEGELLNAQSQLKATEDSLAHAQKMYRKGYIARLQLEAHVAAVAMAHKSLQGAGTKLMVLVDFTRGRTIREYMAEIEKQKAYLTAARDTMKLSKRRRDDVDEQVTKCRCLAPQDGLVVYANDFRREIVIEEGVQVREGQIIIRLPDQKQMLVKTKISDSQINRVQKVQEDCLVKIVLDVDPELQILGKLTKVEPFPYPRRWHGAPIEYGAEVLVIDPPKSLRPGQRAKVHITVTRIPGVLQTPIQSVVERDGNHYCLIRNQAGYWKRQPVKVGANNDRFVIVEDGLKQGDKVALNPDLLWDDVVGDAAEADDKNRPSIVAR